MKLIIINQNAMGQNIYLYFDESTKEGILIDAGDSETEIMSKINQHNVKIKALLLTHGHYDHIACANEIREKTDTKIYCHPDEQQFLENPELNLSTRFKRILKVTPDGLLKDGEIFEIGDTTLKIIHTPGHTPGGLCFYDEKNGVLFTGDTLFRESIGRADLPLSNPTDLTKGIKEKLLTLPSETKVYPGHGESSDIGFEKKYNAYVN
ncbi:MAG: MBL fold metallo-hydrolase [Defluviitaleaceae bacterium]|nr:MBL fold metallo-hydrolase [Defluviitaleaceae bacterium]